MGRGRILRLADWAYESARREEYRKDPGLAGRPYAEQQARLFSRAYVYSDSFSREMRALGYEAEEIVCNVEELQRAWARENGVAVGGDWYFSIVLEQIERLKPDILFLQSGRRFPPGVHGRLKERFPFLKLVVTYKGFPGTLADVAGADILLVSSPAIVEHYSGMGMKPIVAYHAFDQALLGRLGPAPSEPPFPVTFVGSSGFQDGAAYRKRFETLAELMGKTPMVAYIDRDEKKPSRPVKDALRDGLVKALRLVGPRGLRRLSDAVPVSMVRNMIIDALEPRELPRWSELEHPLRELFPGRCRPPVFGLAMYEVLRNSKIAFNAHTAAAEDCVGNSRMFEATGVGACLLTDTGRNMPDLFEADREVVVYKDAKECVEKVRYLLEHEKERRSIAEAGQRRTLRDHTVRRRCERLDELIRARL